jgi:hypothetical protein
MEIFTRTFHHTKMLVSGAPAKPPARSRKFGPIQTYEYLVSQSPRQGNKSGSTAATEVRAVRVHWSTADARALEEAVVRAQMGLLFVGVKM